MRLKKFWITAAISLISTSQLSAKTSCNYYFQEIEFNINLEKYKRITGFFGFNNNSQNYKIIEQSSVFSEYFNSETGQRVEHKELTANDSANTAHLELSQALNGEWSFRWYLAEENLVLKRLTRTSEILFASSRKNNIFLPDEISVQDNTLSITRSKVSTNAFSKITHVVKINTEFTKQSDGSLKLSVTVGSDSSINNRLILGNESHHIYHLKPKNQPLAQHRMMI